WCIRETSAGNNPKEHTMRVTVQAVREILEASAMGGEDYRVIDTTGTGVARQVEIPFSTLGCDFYGRKRVRAVVAVAEADLQAAGYVTSLINFGFTIRVSGWQEPNPEPALKVTAADVRKTLDASGIGGAPARIHDGKGWIPGKVSVIYSLSSTIVGAARNQAEERVAEGAKALEAAGSVVHPTYTGMPLFVTGWKEPAGEEPVSHDYSQPYRLEATTITRLDVQYDEYRGFPGELEGGCGTLVTHT